jgi:hypothetical protein
MLNSTSLNFPFTYITQKSRFSYIFVNKLGDLLKTFTIMNSAKILCRDIFCSYKLIWAEITIALLI